jgi:hypothetical protein
MPATHTPIYLDWTFWAVVIATLALVLSQLPPLHRLFRRAKLTLDVPSRIALTHLVGNAHAAVHVIISNVGGRSIKVTRISAELRRDRHHVTTLPGQNFNQKSAVSAATLLARFTLKPDDEWSHTVNFLHPFSRADDKTFRTASNALKKEILELRRKRDSAARAIDDLVIASEESVAPFMQIFDRLYLWKAGEYEMTIYVETQPARASVQKTLLFSLFESDVQSLKDITSDFRMGDGIYWNSGKLLWVEIPVLDPEESTQPALPR